MSPAPDMPETPGLRGPRQRVRQQVLDATRDLIEAGGYTAFTVDRLVGASGVSKTTVYRWWDNRAHVALDMMMAAYGWPAVPGGASIVDRVRGFIKAEREYHAGPAGPILRGLFADSQHRPALIATLRAQYLAPRHEELQDLLHEGAKTGELRSDLDVEIAAAMVLAPLFQALLESGANEIPDLTDRLLDTLLQGASVTPAADL